MKIGLIKETKIPIDNRVALSPSQIISVKEKYPHVEIYVQKSDIRCYSDDQYTALGVPVIDDMSDCDILIGIKEVDVSALIPNKHYMFYGHIAKEQLYNRELIKKMISLGITFSDYEYFTNENKKLLNFGWWAGVVGTYNTIRAYGIRNDLFELEKPNKNFTLDKLLDNLSEISHLCNTSIMITGDGSVSKGAQYILQKLKGIELSIDEFLNKKNNTGILYTVLKTKDLVKHKDDLPFDLNDFKSNSYNYVSRFDEYSHSAEILLSCHFWKPDQPIYVTESIIKDDNRTIKIIGDITCDIKGSILSTIRSSTHDDPFYDFDPITMGEKIAFSDENNITIMAVDTCPNALALEASEDFGNKLMNNILPNLIENGINDHIIYNATILNKGKLTKQFDYLKTFACQ